MTNKAALKAITEDEWRRRITAAAEKRGLYIKVYQKG